MPKRTSKHLMLPALPPSTFLAPLASLSKLFLQNLLHGAPFTCKKPQSKTEQFEIEYWTWSLTTPSSVRYQTKFHVKYGQKFNHRILSCVTQI